MPKAHSLKSKNYHIKIASTARWIDFTPIYSKEHALLIEDLSLIKGKDIKEKEPTRNQPKLGNVIKKKSITPSIIIKEDECKNIVFN